MSQSHGAEEEPNGGQYEQGEEGAEPEPRRRQGQVRDVLRLQQRQGNPAAAPHPAQQLRRLHGPRLRLNTSFDKSEANYIEKVKPGYVPAQRLKWKQYTRNDIMKAIEGIR